MSKRQSPSRATVKGAKGSILASTDILLCRIESLELELELQRRVFAMALDGATAADISAALRDCEDPRFMITRRQVYNILSGQKTLKSRWSRG